MPNPAKKKGAIALITCRDLPALDGDDRLLLPAFAARAIEVRPAIWDDPREIWSEYRGVILRNCWDYHERLQPFEAWLRRLRSDEVLLANPVDVVLGNIDKRYLRALEARGIPIVPTHWVDAGDEAADLASILAGRGWREAILKPTVSAGSRNTFRCTAGGREDQLRLAGILSVSGAMIQPFLPEIQTEGEWSFLYFGGELSHVVVKTPTGGDFRVQKNFGGKYRTAPRPPAEGLRLAEHVLQEAARGLLYARIDLVRHQGAWVLAELEVTEPSLYFTEDPDSPRRFVAAVERWLDNGHVPGLPGTR